MTREDDWLRWRQRFERTHNGVVRLFHDRAIWRTILAMLDANPAVTRGGHGEYWLGSCYTTSQLIGLRRETDRDRDSIGMMRSLNGLASNPGMATRAWYEEQIRQQGCQGSDFVSRAGMFDGFASLGHPYIDPARVRDDMAALEAVIGRVNRYTNKVLAHRDDDIGRGAPASPAITWADLDSAIDTVGSIHKKYYGLCHPGEALGGPTPIKSREWTRLFEVAWMPPGFPVPTELRV